MPEDHQDFTPPPGDRKGRPKTKQTVHLLGQSRRPERPDEIRLQADQEASSFDRGVDAVARETQDWTPYYRGLLKRAANQAALEGGSSADENAILAIMGITDHEVDPDYRPPQEVLDAEVVAEPEDREAALAARERALEERERALVRRESGLSDDLDIEDLRPSSFKPKTERYVPQPPPPTWSGRKRMTAAERLSAEADGIEMFGDGSAGSAWSSGLPQRTAGTARSRPQPSTGDDGLDAALAAADGFQEEDNERQRTAAAREQIRRSYEEPKETQEDFDKRQAEAQRVVDEFKANRNNLGL